MATTVANLSTTTYVKVNSEKKFLLLQSLRDTVRIVFSDVQPAVGNSVFHTLDGSDEPLSLNDIGTDVWALATTDRVSLVLTEFDTQSVHTYPQFVDLERGFFEDLETEYAYGKVTHVDVPDNPRTVWSFGDNDASPRLDRKAFPTGADTNFFVASSSSADKSVEFTCVGIDANGDAQTHVVSTDATDGQTPVQFGPGLDINFVFMSGDSQVNLGEIYFTNLDDFTLGRPDTPSSVLAHVPIGYGCSPQSLVRVPNGKRLIVKEFIITISRDSGAEGSVILHCKATRPNGSEITVREWHIQNGSIVVPATKMVFEAGSIIEMVLDDVSDTNTNCGVEMHFVFEEVA